MDDYFHPPVFEDVESFMRYFRARAEVLAMDARRTTLARCEPVWRVFGKMFNGLIDGRTVRTFIAKEVARKDGRFFRIAGVEISAPLGREVRSWCQPMIIGDGGGYVALVEQEATRHHLVRLKAEPGNIGIQVEGKNTRVLVAPPIQFSRSNLEHNQRALRGETDEGGHPIRPIPMTSIVTDGRYATLEDMDFWERAVEDGGRFYEKVNRYGLIEVTRREELDGDIQALPEEDRENFCWITLELLLQLRRRGLINGHMRSGMSLIV